MNKCVVIFFLLLFNNAFSQLQPVSLEQGTVQGTPAESNSNPVIDRILSIVNTVEGNNNFTDQISPDSTAALPFGILKQIGAARYIICIDSMTFKPQGAYFSACAGIDFPGTPKRLVLQVFYESGGMVVRHDWLSL